MYFIKFVVLVLACMIECISIEAAALPSSTEGQGIVNEIIPILENELDGNSKGVTWTLVRQILQSVPATEREDISSSMSGESLSQLDLSEVDISSGEKVTDPDSQATLPVHPTEDLEEVSNDIFEMIPKHRLHSDVQGHLISIDSNTIGNHTNFSFMHSNVAYWNASHEISTEENSEVLNELSLTLSDSSEEISSDSEEQPPTVKAEVNPKGQEEQFMRETEQHQAEDRASSEAVDRATSEAVDRATSEEVDRATSEAVDRATSEAVDRATSEAVDPATSEAVDPATSEADHMKGKAEEQPSSEAVDHPTRNAEDQPSSQAMDHTTGKAEEQPSSEEVEHPARISESESVEHPTSESVEHLLVVDNQRNESVKTSQSTEFLQEFQGSLTSDSSKDDLDKISTNIPENISLHELNNSLTTVTKSISSLSSELSSDSASAQSTENEFEITQNGEQLSETKTDTLTSTLADKQTVVINNDLTVLLPEVTVNHTEVLIQEDKVTDVNSTDETIPQCPEPGICIFWFLAVDTCSIDNHCLGSGICCKVRCSNTCVEI